MLYLANLPFSSLKILSIPIGGMEIEDKQISFLLSRFLSLTQMVMGRQGFHGSRNPNSSPFPSPLAFIVM